MITAPNGRAGQGNERKECARWTRVAWGALAFNRHGIIMRLFFINQMSLNVIDNYQFERSSGWAAHSELHFHLFKFSAWSLPSRSRIDRPIKDHSNELTFLFFTLTMNYSPGTGPDSIGRKWNWNRLRMRNRGTKTCVTSIFSIIKLLI